LSLDLCMIEFHIGGYHDWVFHNVLHMDACQILLGWTLQCDRGTIYDGKMSTSQNEKENEV